MRVITVPRACVTALLAGALAASAGPAALGAAAPRTVRASVGTGDVQANGAGSGAAISAGGRLVAFVSLATDLVPGATARTSQVYLRNLATGRTSLVSRNRAGIEGQGSVDSFGLGMSGDGEEVVFASAAPNLVPRDRNGVEDVFVRDRRAGVTRLVSRSSAGLEGNGASGFGVISADGRFVAFQSYATNLAASDRNGRADVFVRDLRTGRTRLVSRSDTGGFANGTSFPVAISRHGRYVAFDAVASNIAPGTHLGRTVVYVRDMARHRTTRVSPAGAGAPCYGTSMTPDGRDVVFDSKAGNLVAGDTNAAQDVFVADRTAHTVTRVSVATGGGQQLGPGDTYLEGGSISADGRLVAFASLARDLVGGDTNAVYDVFVHDLVADTTVRESVSSAGVQGDRRSLDPRISAGGRMVVFASSARDLVPRDTNGLPDIFVRGPLRG
jgi:Tol biopolymer transport system component